MIPQSPKWAPLNSRCWNVVAPALVIPCLILSSRAASEEVNTNSGAIVKQQIQTLTFTSPAYSKEALKLLIQEANSVAAALHLAEELPITEAGLKECYISPPRMARMAGTFGNITTGNYTYFASVGNKFSFLTKNNLASDYPELKNKYLWPVSKLDTNTAFLIATQYLRSVCIDVDGLQRDCAVVVRPYTPNGKNADNFVPVYWIFWQSRNPYAVGSEADLEIFLPTKEVRQLHVNSSKYILREPLCVANIDRNLSEPDALKSHTASRADIGAGPQRRRIK